MMDLIVISRESEHKIAVFVTGKVLVKPCVRDMPVVKGHCDGDL